MMVARTNNNVLSENRCYGINHKNSRSCWTPDNRADASTMNFADADKENHLIEAIVFTTDFLSCTKKPAKGSPWICGSGDSDETFEADEPDSYSDDGWFGLKRRQLISYKNAEDLTRKVNDLFHRKRSPLSAGAAAEIRDDFSEEDDCFHEDENSDHRFFTNLQRRIDDAASTCPSTNPSLSQDELNQWYSSSWSSFTYYGSAKENYGVHSAQTTGSNSKHHRSLRSLPAPSSRRDPSSRDRGYEKKTRQLEGCDHISSRSSSSMPDILKGVEFKNNNHHHHVISLPRSPPTFSSSGNKKNQEMIPQMDAPVPSQTQNKKGKARTKGVDSRAFASKKLRHRQFGRKTRVCWEKAKGLFHR